jgi:apolipoprotein N-acyltransferase
MVTLLAVLLTGAMWFASSGVNHVWPLAWIAPLPLLLILPDLPGGRAALVAWAASSLGALNLVLAYSHAPPVVLGLAVLLISLPFALLSSVWRLVARRGSPPIAAVAYPALVASMEYLVSCVSPHGTFGSLAYSQADLPPALQLAPITGLWGISFLVSLVPSAIAAAWRGRRSPSAVRIGLGLATIPLALTLALGTLRLAATPWHSFVRVGLVTRDSALDAFGFAATDSGMALPLVRLYANRVAELARRQAVVVVLPEKFVGVTPAYAELARGILGKVAREHGLTVVAGFNQLDSASH